MGAEYPRKMLLPTAKEFGIHVAILSPEEAESIRDRARDVFAKSTEVLSSETLGPGARVTCPQSWTLIGSFMHSDAVVVFTNWRDGEAVFKFDSIGYALTVLGESPPFDFYMLDCDCTFLFAHDEYDNLFGCGKAASFVRAHGGTPFGIIS
jgi:hypothetical protein